jgi:hypothetical protein
MDNYYDLEKNQNRMDSLVVNACAKRCFSNFKSDKVMNQENICLSNCVLRYFDSLVFGEQVFDHLSKQNKKDIGNFNESSTDFKNIVNRASQKLNYL